MKSPKKRTRPSQTPVVLYKRDFDRIKMNVTDEVLTLLLGYLMDDLDYDEDRILEVFEGVSRYHKAVKDHLITIKQIKKIIKEKTGLDLLGWK